MYEDSPFKIYVHQLVGGRVEEIEEALSPAFMDVQETELAFKVPVQLRGTAELSEKNIFLKLRVETEATLPCAICNRDVQVKIFLPDFSYIQDIEALKGDIFDFREVLREAILLELPYAAECQQGQCPERAQVAKYFASQEGETSEEKNYPFKDL